MRDVVDHSSKPYETYQMGLSKFGTNSDIVRVRRSALWAAYGDALGWISELTDERGLARRTRENPLVQPIEWTRRIGGRSGVNARIRKGCYSDDSQLRLATCRAIRQDGFDVEAFAKVELPVWLSYALGGGKSTSAAAKNLSRRNVQWYANRFKGWTRSGGNGAAMRIQPHVWSAKDPSDPTSYLWDVSVNAICTHSHPNGILGAVLHALTLGHAMSEGAPPRPEEIVASIDQVATYVLQKLKYDALGRIWLANFEREAGPFADEWNRAIAECKNALNAVGRISHLQGETGYEAIVDQLRLREPDLRGSGMLTSLAAVGLTWCESRPAIALGLAANALGTDTDTIATMAGALIGANAENDPPTSVMDAPLFREEADRMHEISRGRRPRSFSYPDLLHWVAPKTQADCLRTSKSGEYHVTGLGPVQLESEPMKAGNSGFMWQWVRTGFGQTLLIKRRETLPEIILSERLASETNPEGKNNTADIVAQTPAAPKMERDLLPDFGDLPFNEREVGTDSPSPVSAVEFSKMVDYLEHHKYSNEAIGGALRSVAKRCTTHQTLEFYAILTKRLSEI